MDLDQIRYFVTLARALNFTKAAEECEIAQPSLTKAIKKLEQQLGGILIHRERGLTQLSDFGRTMLPLLQETIRAAEAVKVNAARYHLKDIASLRIGLLPSISSGLLTQPLAELKLDIPNIRVEILEDKLDHLLRGLMDGDFDVILSRDCHGVMDRIDKWQLFEERYVIVASSSHPVAQTAYVDLRDVDRSSWLACPQVDPELLDEIRHLLPGLDPDADYVTSRLEHIQHLAAAGLGVILAPEHTPTLPSLVRVPIAGDPIKRVICLMAVSGRQHTPAIAGLIRKMRRRRWNTAPALVPRPAANEDLHAGPGGGLDRPDVMASQLTR